jgi:hypothetical protein
MTRKTTAEAACSNAVAWSDVDAAQRFASRRCARQVLPTRKDPSWTAGGGCFAVLLSNANDSARVAGAARTDFVIAFAARHHPSIGGLTKTNLHT